MPCKLSSQIVYNGGLISQRLAAGENLTWARFGEIQQIMLKVTNYKKTIFESLGQVNYRSIINIQGQKIDVISCSKK